MKFDVEIDDLEIKHRIREYIYRQLSPSYLKHKIIEEADHQIEGVVKEMLNEHDLNELMIKGMVKYLEKYKIQDIVNICKTKYTKKTEKVPK